MASKAAASPNESPSMTYDALKTRFLSNKPSAPSYGFGTGKRKHFDKIYNSKKLAAVKGRGLNSPGPKYLCDSKVVFKSNPAWSIKGKLQSVSKAEKDTTPVGTFDEVLSADFFRRRNDPRVIFNKENRFPKKIKRDACIEGISSGLFSANAQNFANPPSYTFGLRTSSKERNVKAQGKKGRQTLSKLDPNWHVLSDYPVPPAFSIPRDGELNKASSIANPQTFEVYSSLGPQARSQKLKAPSVPFDKSSQAKTRVIFCRDDIVQKRLSLPQPHAYY